MRSFEENRDRGTATVLAAMLVLALVSLVWMLAQLGTAVLDRQRVAGAADLAALAAATRAPEGQRAACDQARRVADRMRGSVVECRLVAWDARVQVQTQHPLFAGNSLVIAELARAGPAQSDVYGR